MRLDRKKFEEWLRAKPTDHIVGHTRDCHTCPLARWYYEASNGCEVVISADPNSGGYQIDRGYSTKPVPWWAEQFIFAVDGSMGQITANRALEILTSIPR